jgi:hypothetical protein
MAGARKKAGYSSEIRLPIQSRAGFNSRLAGSLSLALADSRPPCAAAAGNRSNSARFRHRPTFSQKDINNLSTESTIHRDVFHKWLKIVLQLIKTLNFKGIKLEIFFHPGVDKSSIGEYDSLSGWAKTTRE